MKKDLPVRGTPLQLLMIFLVLAGFSATIGYLYYAHQRRQIIADREKELFAIAELKANEISRWLKERRRDGRAIGGNPLVERNLQQWLREPRQASLKEEISPWLHSIRDNFDYRTVALTNKNGDVYLCVPAGKGICPDIKAYYAKAIATREPLFFDLHRSPMDEAISCGLLIPILDRQKSATIGILVLEIDPTKFLYPFVQSWPTTSHTGETLLVRREGDEVVFLNELRHRKNTALSLRFPIAENQSLPAAKAFSEEGVVEGVDYRGVAVLAALKAVPDSPWFLIAKVDMEEISAPVHERAWLAALLAGLLIALAGASVMLIWRHQKIDLYQKQYELEREKRELTARYQHLTKYANDSIMLADIKGQIMEVNERATAMYGYTQEEFLRLNIRDIRAREHQGNMERQWRQIREHNGLVFETVHRHKTGSKFPVEISARMVQLGGADYYWGTIRDISDRKRTEQILRESEQRYRALFEDSPISLWEKDYTGIKKYIEGLTEEKIADFRTYFDLHPEAVRHAASLVRIIDLNKATLDLYQAGSKEELRKGLMSTLDEEFYHLFKEGLLAICERKMEFEAETLTRTLTGEQRWVAVRGTVAPGSESTLARVLVSGIDITKRKQAEEALRKTHDELETRVAERTAELTALNAQLKQEIREREAAEEAMAEQSRILEAFFKHSTMPLVFLTPGFDLVRVNDAYANACQKRVKDLIGRNLFELHPSNTKPIFEQALATKTPYKALASPFIFPDHRGWGATYWDWALVPLLDDRGEVELLVFTLNDVTERCWAEECLQKSEEKYRELVENANSIIMKVDGSGRITFFNEFAQTFFGFAEKEIIGKHAIGTIIPERDSAGNDLTQMVRDFKEHPERYTSNENENMRRDGSRVWVSWTNKVLFDGSGQLSGLLCIGSDISDRKRTEQALRDSEQQLRFLSSKLLTAQEEERKRISRELHDSIGSSLSAIKFGLENYLKYKHNGPDTEGSLKSLIDMSQDAIEEVRRIMSDLRPSILDDLGLRTTLGWFFRQFLSIHTNMCIEDEINVEENDIPEDLKIVIFRVIQEAFHNISKYSRAESIDFTLEKNDGSLELTIQDNGAGFDLRSVLVDNTNRKGLGLTSMRERVELSGGWFGIESEIGTGTTVQARWSFSRETD